MTKYLDKQDKEEMARWRELIINQGLILEGLKEAYNIWFYKKLVGKYGLDPTKANYDLDPQNGQIREIKKENND